MRRKIFNLSFIIVLVLAISCVVVSAAELKFSDIDNHWAQNEIYNMANKWVILGYPDGTFKPNDNIIKTHAFLMFARLNGYFDTENELLIEKGINRYAGNLERNGITEGVAEIAFLIQNGVISYEEVIELLGNGKQNENLTREEAAYIYVKLLDDEENLNRFPLVTFDDAEEIQEQYLAYVEYVNKIGLMIGYDNKFDPQEHVTRAQVATILSRIDKIIYERTATKVQGLITNVDISGNFIEIDVEGDKQIYILSRDFSVYENDKKVSKTTLKENDLVTLYIDSGIVGKVTVDNVEKVIYANYLSYTTTTDKTIINVEVNGQQYSYPLLNNVQIVKNENNIEIESIVSGEKIEIIVINNSVSNILVGAFSNTEVGMIKEIVIGDVSYISIKDLKGETHKYLIAENVEYDFDGAQGTIYDLRLDMDVKLTVTHNGITKVKVETLTDVEVISGLVEQILPKLYVFTIRLDNGQIQMMFLDKEETVIKTKNGLAKTIDDVMKNDLVSVYGRYEGDVFYPIQVIIYE